MLVLASPKRSLKSTIFLTKNFTSELYLKMTLSYILSMCLNEKTTNLETWASSIWRLLLSIIIISLASISKMKKIKNKYLKHQRFLAPKNLILWHLNRKKAQKTVYGEAVVNFSHSLLQIHSIPDIEDQIGSPKGRKFERSKVRRVVVLKGL